MPVLDDMGSGKPMDRCLRRSASANRVAIARGLHRHDSGKQAP